MIVLPMENKLDWRHPPLVTMLLLLLNTFVFFASVGSDEEAMIQAFQVYTANDLLAEEAAAYRSFRESQGEQELPEDSQVNNLVFDLAFDAYLREHPPATATDDWRQRRDQFEAARNEVSWIGYGLVPAQPSIVTLFTSMYLHGGVWHLFGNMVFLFVFGFSLERSLGWLSYIALYHLTGVVSGLACVLILSDSYVPGIGASGAVSGLMGAYIAVYRLRKIRFFYSFLIYFGEFRAPAFWVFPFWLAKELYGNFYGDQGISYWAHIGGLISGVGLGLSLSLFTKRVDESYLDERAHTEARVADKQRLDTLVDEFKYAQAKSLARRMLDENPTDTHTWSIFVSVLRANTNDPDYHRAVLRIVSLVPRTSQNPQLVELVEQTFRMYMDGDHPKPAFKNSQLLQQLGLAFTRGGRLDYAQEIAELLLKNKKVDDESRKFLTALIARLKTTGQIDEAKRYGDLLLDVRSTSNL